MGRDPLGHQTLSHESLDEGARSQDIARGVWDAVVIGAGPAGATSAFVLARSGRRVLLLERSRWPRDKVCGGCLSADALAALDAMGLGDVVSDAVVMQRTHVRRGGLQASWPMTRCVALDRRTLDARLVRAFVEAGGTFVAEAGAKVIGAAGDAEPKGDVRQVDVRVDGETHAVRAGVVLACDGLRGSSLSGEPWAAWRVADDAYMGVAATLEDKALSMRDTAAGLDGQAIHMHIGDAGYVGVALQRDGRWHVAAALSPQACRDQGGPAAVMHATLRGCGVDATLRDATVRGTPTLTRRREALAGHRVMCVGDACGYVEPFTGEGIAWALRSARAATALLHDRQGTWPDDMPQRWAVRHRATVKRKQAICRAVRYTLHRPRLSGATVRLLRHAPKLATWASAGGAR